MVGFDFLPHFAPGAGEMAVRLYGYDAPGAINVFRCAFNGERVDDVSTVWAGRSGFFVRHGRLLVKEQEPSRQEGSI